MENQASVMTQEPTFEIIAQPERFTTVAPFDLSTEKWFGYKSKLQKKISRVRRRVGTVAKRGKNQRDGYTYAMAGDIYDAVREIMDDEELGFQPRPIREWEEYRQTSNGRNAPITKVEIVVEWTDLETGYFEEMRVIGSGLDYGDKGIYKAYTGAEKYAFVIEFAIPTADDPENDQKGDPYGDQQSGGKGNSNSGGQTNGRGANSRSGGRGGTKEPEAGKSTQNGAQKAGDSQPTGNAPIARATLAKLTQAVTILGGLGGGDTKENVKGIYGSLKKKIQGLPDDPKAFTESQGKKAIGYVEAWTDEKKRKKAKEEAEKAEDDKRPVKNEGDTAQDIEAFEKSQQAEGENK